MKNKFSKFLILLFLSVTISCGNSNSKEKNDTIEVSNTTLKNDTLVETEIVSEKKKILQNLIGEHSLTLISGTSGANAMSDYVFEKDKWVATGSSIYQAMRQGYDIDISDENLKKLKSMKIKVYGDLSVSLICNNKEYFKTPFNESGLSYLLTNSPKDYYGKIPENISPSTIILDDNLYLYAKDKFSENELNEIDIEQINADAVTISYNLKTKKFELLLFYGDCCDESKYFF